MRSISERIKELRIEKGYSRKKMAEISGVSQPTIYNIENGATDNITLTVGKKISKALNVSFSELFNIEDSKTASSELSNKITEMENEIERLKSTLNDKVIMVEMYKNEKIRIIKDIMHFLEETHDMRTYYLNNDSSYSTFQKREINTIMNMMNKIAASSFVATGLITESDLDKIIPKHKSIVRPGDPEEKK